MVSRQEQVRAESELAKKLGSAPADERRSLYAPVYDEIYSMWLSREPDKLDFGASPSEIATLINFTSERDKVLEIGCGTGMLAIGLNEARRDVTAVDVSQVALERARERAGARAGLEFVGVDGVALPFADASFDFAYSVEVIEHLHADDAVVHFQETARVLRPGASYWFQTPSPHASRSAAERFAVGCGAVGDVHLKEWTHHELTPVLRRCGFSRVRFPLTESGRRSTWLIPAWVTGALEGVPGLSRARIGRLFGLSQCVVLATR
ncbi:MAG: class I SAM-dependent methyltransferase [Solirubrobacteraceae bacterium]